MTTEFGLLGEVEARVDGRAIDLGHARQRCVLAVLLVEANHPVSADQLLDRVWGEQQPYQARGTLRSYLSRLRQVLGQEEQLILRRSGGYAVVVDEAAVDLHRFRNLVSRVRSADRDEDALVLLDEALGLWRGEAFGSLDNWWLNAVRDTLDKERLAAELDHTEIQLRLGRHADLVAELCARAAAHPLDERLAGQLMLTLYRCGRQTDALEHYRRLRTRLVDDFGTDPGPQIQQLHRQILAADPAAAAPAVAASAGMRPVVPRQLPAAIANLVGRDRELEVLGNQMDTAMAGARTVVITAVGGTAGIGKTTLAVYWGRQVADRFPDGQLYVNLRGFDPGAPMTPAEAVRRFLDAFQVPVESIPADVDSQVALYRSLTEHRRLLIVLDNARDASQVRPLLPGGPTCLVVVTSRQQLAGLVARDQAQLVTLDLLDADRSRQLLTGLLGPDRVRRAAGAVDELVDLCVGLPLALCVAAARTLTDPTLPLGSLVAELREERHRLDALTLGDGVDTDVAAVFSWSYRALSADAARLFRLLGLHPGPDIALPAAACLAGSPARQTRELLAELVRANLLDQHASGRYQLHDLLRAYAAQVARGTDPDPDRAAARRRLLDHYLHSAYAAERVVDPQRDPVTLGVPAPGASIVEFTEPRQALSWLRAEHPALVAMIALAVEFDYADHAWQLPWTLSTFFSRQGRWHDWLTTQRIALDAAERLGDRTEQARVHRIIGNVYRRLGQHDETCHHYLRSLGLSRELGDELSQAHAQRGLAWAFEQNAQYEEALAHAEAALRLYSSADNRSGEGYALNAVGWCQAKLGRLEPALANCRLALDLHRRLGDRAGEADTLDSVGYVHHRLIQYEEAGAHYRQALDLLGELGAPFEEATTLGNLGDVERDAGRLDAAAAAYQRAVAIFEEFGNPGAAKVKAKLAELDLP